MAIRFWILIPCLLALVAATSQGVLGKHPKQREHIRNHGDSGKRRDLVETNIFFPIPNQLQMSAGAIFTQKCEYFLLSKPILIDQVIASSEYASFLAQQCLNDGTCNQSDNVSFQTLNPNLQTLFMQTACPTTEASNCTQQIKAMGSDFGIIASPQNLLAVDQEVQSLCNETYSIASSEGIMNKNITATVTPTSSPSALQNVTTQVPVTPTSPPMHQQPTQAPTHGPTLEHSMVPSSHPTIHSTGGTIPGGIFQNTRTGLTTAGLLGIISAASAVIFCLAVVWSGRGWKEPEYDMNRDDKSVQTEATRKKVPTQNDDKMDDPHVGRHVSPTDP